MRHLNTPINVVGFVSMIDGNVDFVLLKRAIMAFVSRNEAFRLRFTEVGEEIRQYARMGDFNFEIGICDFSAMAEPTRAMDEWLDQNTREPIAYTDEQLFEFTMFRVSSESGGFLTKFHHMIGDGWSAQLLTRAIGDLYMNELNKEERGIAKEDPAGYLYCVTEQEEAYFASARSDRDRRFWKEQFRTLPVPMFEDDPDQIAGARSSYLLGHSLSAKLKQLMNKLDCSDNTIFTGLILLYLHLNLKRDDLVIGTPVFNRSGRHEKEIFGLFSSLKLLDLSSFLWIIFFSELILNYSMFYQWRIG
ncbi:hypothetical protein AM231_16355 [Paenibacillus solani]|uniref:Condensation domain-containing protein n=1 Tax=Paenibacillus solani TaxID=1705565 RepID=A0A0M1P934_9BACL|nr:condensation domain-containing protein [Paenibacillus solani]KOR90544.1 hypothetical protein AM231_16355 [Paenibacillus solani]